MARKIAPCYKCPDRKAECKKYCEPFKEWDIADKIERDRINALKNIDRDADGVKISGINKVKIAERAMKGKPYKG